MTTIMGVGAGVVGPLRSLCAKRRANVQVRVVDGETVVLDRQRQLIHQLNQTASYVWDRCDGQHAVTEIAKGIFHAFNVDLETAERDVAALVRRLGAMGLVELVVPSER